MSTIKRWRQSVAVLAAMLLGVAGQAQAQHGSDKNGPVVQTSEGPVRGFVNNGVYHFLGIPYAAPPVGAWRWRPPQAPKTRKALLDATAYGNICPQVTTLGVFAGPASVDEDCLYLNVFTTKLGKGDTPQSAGLPVIVWIHGGGNVDGTAADYDGSKLASGGPVGVPTVIVTINYRLGLFGFLAHPALNAENHPFANYGIMDIQAALRWVQRNAAAFGGDATRVTLGGQSAGATDTGANLIAPSSAGLFQRAIFQSSPLNALPPLSIGLTRGADLGMAAGCGSGADVATAACLRALSASRILQLQGTAGANGPYITGPMVDGSIVPISPNTAWTAGRFNRMPVMAGHGQDEATFGIGITEYFSGPTQAPINKAQYVANITTTYSGPEYAGGPNYPKGTVEAVLKQYPPASDPPMALNLAGSQAKQNLRDYIERNLITAQKAYKAGARLLVGSDAVYTAYGLNMEELRWFVKLSMSNEQALQSATVLPAEMLGMDKSLGSVSPGYIADIVAVDGDPLADIEVAITTGRWVMKTGSVVVDKTKTDWAG